MPYVPVPKDLTKVKTKLAFNLTKRQLICFSLAALVGLQVYFLTREMCIRDRDSPLPKPSGNGLQDWKTRHFYRPGQKADICPTFVHQR